ncbi:MAG: SDR family NAD(P)-dependent oxidoreductase [Actinomycetota bacterium]
MKLEGRSCIVVGAGRGIGAEVARAFAREGARLTLAARTKTELEQVADELKNEVQIVQADVSDEDSTASIVRMAIEHFGGVDVLVNAAGIYGPIGNAWEVDLQGWKQAMEINMFGFVHLCRAALPAMIARGAGSIITFAGGGAASPLPRFTAYGTSKAAMVRYVETIAEELKDTGVRVNAIAPGLVDTKLQDDVLAAGANAGDLLQKIRKARETGEGTVSPELPASLALFLASDESKPLTGKLIAAPYDGWESWDAKRIDEVMQKPWFTLRRIDRATLKPFTEGS